MRRLTMILTLAAMLGAAPMAPAAASFTQEGTVTAPNPASAVFGGITETLNPCGRPNPDLREVNGGNFNGVDGWWITLPVGAPGKNAALELDWATATLDVQDLDVFFYNDECSPITLDQDEHAYDMATIPETRTVEDDDDEFTTVTPEEGVIPADAAYAIVVLIVGQDAPFIFTIE